VEGMKICMVALAAAVTALVSGCDHGNNVDDAGIHDGDGGIRSDGSDGSSGDAGDRGADEAGWNFIITPGLGFCQWNVLETRRPPYGDFQGKIRIWLKESSVRWPDEQESLEVDLVDRVEVSPDGETAESRGPGLLRAHHSQGGSEEWIVFSYSQEYGLGSEIFQASFGFHIELPVQATQIDLKALLIEEDYTCEVQAGHVRGKVSAEAGNGDRVEFEYFYLLSFYCPPGMACMTPNGLGDVIRGVFTGGSGERVVDSYFRTGLACGHHAGPNRFLMFFDEQLGGVHGIELAPQIQGGANYQLIYLGENLASIRIEEVVDITWDDPGFQP